MRQLETSGAHLHGARERAFDVPEELGFRQAFGNGCGVEGDKRLIAPRENGNRLRGRVFL